MIRLNYRDARPIYEQVKDGLRHLVVTGALQAGDRLPSVRALASTLAINPNTIQRAYEALEREGYLYTVAGKGSFAARQGDVNAERRERLLKLMAMNHYDMEANSRIENLVAFKKAYGGSLLAVTHCLEKFFPRMTDEDVQGFLYAFFPFMFGIYPYTAVTEQQRTAMELAGVGYVRISVRELTRSFTAKLLQGFQM